MSKLKPIGALMILYAIVAFILNLSTIGLFSVPQGLAFVNNVWVWNPFAQVIIPQIPGVDLFLIGSGIAWLAFLGIAAFWSLILGVFGFVMVLH